MRRKRREMELRHLRVQQSKIVFDHQQEVIGHCSICRKHHQPLINPCECPTKFHERCLLLYIKGVITRGQQRRREQVDLSRIRCRVCEGQFHLKCTPRGQYSCQVFTRRMGRNCCNKHLAIITILIIVIIVTVVIFINQFQNASPNPNLKLRYALIALLVLQGLILLAISAHFVHAYMYVRQIVLQRVLDMTELRSMTSTNSDDNKISDDCSVVVR